MKKPVPPEWTRREDVTDAMARQPKHARQPKKDDEFGDEFDEVLKTVGSRFRDVRKKLGLTQAQLAAKAGVGQPYIFELEQGTTNISIKTLVKMASFLEIDPRELLPDHPSSPPTVSGVERLAVAFDNMAEAIRQRSSQDAEMLTEFRAAAGLREAIDRFLNKPPVVDPPGEPSRQENTRVRVPRRPR